MRNNALTVVAAVSLVIVLAAWMTRGVSTREPVRDLAIVVRGMTFYVNGGKDPNPVLRFRAGERVRIRLRNEDAGMTHNLWIEEWNVGTPVLKGQDEVVVELRVPDAPGAAAYVCRPHPAAMRGSIVIE